MAKYKYAIIYVFASGVCVSSAIKCEKSCLLLLIMDSREREKAVSNFILNAFNFSLKESEYVVEYFPLLVFVNLYLCIHYYSLFLDISETNCCISSSKVSEV